MLCLITDTILELGLDEEERLATLGKRERKKKGKKRAMKEEEDSCIKQMKKEMDEMRNTIAKLQATAPLVKKSEGVKIYALGFKPDEYLALGFIESANWIAETLAVKMKARMEESPGKWLVLKKFNPPEMRSLVTCVAYNRGDTCRLDKWHTFQKKASSGSDLSMRNRLNWADPQLSANREELRIHACTLCWKAIGVLSMHNVMECPWILEENWK
jgi:hypothetical protein